MPAEQDELLQRFNSIRVWERGDRRAVHKPLLVLLALGRLWRGEPAMVPFARVEPELRNLLARFGPTSAQASVHYPFWHLRTDQLWELQGPTALLDRPAGATPSLTEMRESVSGGFPQPVLAALSSDTSLILRLARRIAEAHFPESLQPDVLQAVGLPAEQTEPPATAEQRRRRDASFREKILRAYEYRCCVCNHDLRLLGEVVGLDAAHIMWFQAGGPDIEPNGLALCSLHHKLFDLGVFTVLTQGYTMAVSQHMTGGEDAKARMLTYHGAALIMPQSRTCLPAAAYLEWHKKEVFKEPARDT